MGQAERSTSSTSLSLTLSSPAMIMASIRSSALSPTRPASMGPPETKIAGILRRMAAMSMPGSDLVAVGDADHGVGLVSVAHVLHRVGDQIARGQGIEHAIVAHGDTIINGNGVEFCRKAGRVLQS